MVNANQVSHLQKLHREGRGGHRRRADRGIGEREHPPATLYSGVIVVEVGRAHIASKER